MKRPYSVRKVIRTSSHFRFAIAFLLLASCPFLSDVAAQEMTVRGTVLYNPNLGECFAESPCLDDLALTRDEDWIPPTAAVNIAVRGTDTVVKTDRDGRYEVTVPSPDATLIFMFIGHNRMEEPVRGRSTVDFRLTPTPLPVIDRLLGLIMPKIHSGIYPDIDRLAEEAGVNRETARDLLWLVIGNRPMMTNYPDELIPDYRFDD